jgi:hypothetical protein
MSSYMDRFKSTVARRSLGSLHTSASNGEHMTSITKQLISERERLAATAVSDKPCNTRRHKTSKEIDNQRKKAIYHLGLLFERIPVEQQDQQSRTSLEALRRFIMSHSHSNQNS